MAESGEGESLPAAQSVWGWVVSPGDAKIYSSEASLWAFVWEAAGEKSSLRPWNQQCTQEFLLALDLFSK